VLVGLVSGKPGIVTDYYYSKPEHIDLNTWEIEEVLHIKKDQLQDDVTYQGSCRNTSEAVWHADINKFVYTRRKGGESFLEEINHFEDDNGYDLFYPSKIKDVNGVNRT